MNRVVAVPNWSFYDPDLATNASSLLTSLKVKVHYVRGDIDHQRTVTAFSGDQPAVFAAALELARFLLPKIDLRNQIGVHPRVGALDVMPFVLLEGDEQSLVENCRIWAAKFSSTFEIPHHLYEKAAYSGSEPRLPVLRGQVKAIDGLSVPDLEPNSKWGISIIGVRNFLLATNIDAQTDDLSLVQAVAKRIRTARDGGNLQLQGVRALGFALKSRGLTQLSLNITDPDNTSFDEIYDFARREFQLLGVEINGTELIGVIRERDLSGAKHLQVDPRQVVT